MGCRIQSEVLYSDTTCQTLFGKVTKLMFCHMFVVKGSEGRDRHVT